MCKDCYPALCLLRTVRDDYRQHSRLMSVYSIRVKSMDSLKVTTVLIRILIAPLVVPGKKVDKDDKSGISTLALATLYLMVL